MPETKCPNINSPEYMELEKELGEVKAFAAWVLNDDEIPTVEKAKELLSKPAIYFQLSNNDIKTIKHELQTKLQGKSKEAKGDYLETATSFFRGNERTSGQSSQEINQQGGSQGSFYDFITKNNLWYNKKLPEKSIGKGAEQIVYRNSPNTVIKVNNGEHYKSWKDYLDNLIIHNYFFEGTSYKLLGFIKPEGLKDIEAVVEQPFIDDSNKTPATIEQIRNYLAEEGFLPTEGAKRDFNYYNKDYGIHIDDLHDKNVLTSNGEFFFIDTRCWADGNLWKNEDDNYFQNNTNDIQAKIDRTISQGQQEGIGKTRNSKFGEIGSNNKGINGNGQRLAETQRQNQTARIQKFITSLGGKIEYKPEIVVNGKVVDANAVTDVVKRTIQVADGKEDIKTLPEEAAHIYVHWLPEHSLLLDEMMRGVEGTEFYDQVLHNYKDNPYYQDANGKVDEEKIKKEAVGKMIADAIVNENASRKAKKWWQRLWEWVKGIFKGKNFDNPYSEAASDILDNKVSKLDLKAMKEANDQGEIYFQLSDKDKSHIAEWKKGATEIQKEMIDKFVLNNKMSLDIASHTYTDATDPSFVWKSLTTAIKGYFEGDIAAINREVGTQLHTIMEGIIMGKSFKDIEDTPLLPDHVKGMVYNALQELVRNLKEDGSILIPETIITHKDKGIATSIDIIKIKPDGTRTIVDLKTSQKRVLDDKGKPTTDYLSKAWDVKEGSVIGEKLTTNQQHGIQVAAQDRMIDNLGYPNSEEPETYHIQVTLKDGKADSIYVEGFILHPIGANSAFVDKILGPDRSEFPKMQEPETDQEQKAEDVITPTLESIKKEFIRRKASPLDEMRTTSINELKNTVSKIDNLQKAGEIKEAFGTALSYIQGLTRDSLAFISKDINFDHKQYFQFLTESIRLANSNDELLPDHLEDYLSDSQKNTFHSVKRSLSELQRVATIKAKEFVIKNMTPKGDDEKLIDYSSLYDEYFPKWMKDISLTGSWTTNFDSLHNVFIQEATHIMLTDQRLIAVKDRETQEHLNKVGNDARLVIGSDYDKPGFFDQFYTFDKYDKDGKPAKGAHILGFVDPTGDKYYDTLDSLQNNLLNDQGERKQPIPIKDLKTATQEDIDYNIDLYHAKKAMNKFREAETLNKDTGEIETGKYHHYSDEFIEARDKVLRPVIHTDYEGFPIYFEYIPKEGLSENSKEVQQFRNKYQVKDEYDSMVMKAGRPTGIFVKKEGYFDNRNYVVINDFAHGEDIRNPKWTKLNSPKDDKERAVLSVYNAVVESFNRGAKKMGGEAERYVAQMGLMATSNKIFQKAAKNGVMGFLSHQAVEFFTAVHKSNIENTDVNGVVRMSHRMPVTGNFRSQQKIDEIEKKIVDLVAKKPNIGKKAYREQLKELNIELERESHKMSPEDVETDPIKQAILYEMGANAYDTLERSEGKMLALQYALGEQKFVKTTGTGVPKVDREGNSVAKQKEDVNAFRAMNALMKNRYGIKLDDTQIGVVIKRTQNLTSFVVMGLNFFNGMNNALLYQFNLAGQTLAKRYGLTPKSWTLTQKEIISSYVPGLTQGKFDKQLKYGKSRPHSSLEAYMHTYGLNVDNKGAEGLPKILGKAYLFENAAIDWAQVALVGTGIRDFQIKNYNTGEMIPVKDAHTYDPNTGKLKLNDGFRIDDVHQVNVKIGDIQTRAQGNYNGLLQPAATRTILGAIGTQFHRFFAPSFNDRFAPKGTHKTLGDTEGAYISLWSFVNILRDTDENIVEDLFSGDSKIWKDTPEYVKANMRFVVMDLLKICVLFAIGAFLKGIADGVDEDNPNQKRWFNFLAYTASRLRFEQQMFVPAIGTVQLAEYAQNPFAISQTLKTFAEALVLSTEFPLQSDDDRYYKNGVFTGDSKAAHQWGRLIPLKREYQQWQNRIKATTAEGELLGITK